MEKLVQDHAEKEAQLKEKERKAALKKSQGKNKKPAIMKKLFEESSSDESVAVSIHDSDTSNILSDDEDTSESLTSLEINDFILVKVHNSAQTTYRIFTAKIYQIDLFGYQVNFLKRLRRTFRFNQTEESVFVNQKDVIQKLSCSQLPKSGRFANMFHFASDLQQYVSLLD